MPGVDVALLKVRSTEKCCQILVRIVRMDVMTIVVSVDLPQHGGPIFPRVVEAAEECDGGETLSSPKYRTSFEFRVFIDPVEFLLSLLSKNVDVSNRHARRVFGKREKRHSKPSTPASSPSTPDLSPASATVRTRTRST